MSTELHDLLRNHAGELSETVARRLRMSTAPHYRIVNPQLLLARAERFIEAFLTSLAAAPATFTDFIGNIAEERISEGYHLHEIQFALNILQEKVWQLVVEQVPLDEQVQHLSLVTATISDAKDMLAQVYLEHKAARRISHDSHGVEDRRDVPGCRRQRLFVGTKANRG